MENGTPEILDILAPDLGKKKFKLKKLQSNRCILSSILNFLHMLHIKYFKENGQYKSA